MPRPIAPPLTSPDQVRLICTGRIVTAADRPTMTPEELREFNAHEVFVDRLAYDARRRGWESPTC